MSELFNFNFNTTPSILFGSNILLSSVSEIKNILGPRIFLISDPTLSKIGLYNSLVDHLISKGIKIIVNKIAFICLLINLLVEIK